MASALVQLPPMIFCGRGPRADDGDPQGACAGAVAPRARGSVSSGWRALARSQSSWSMIRRSGAVAPEFERLDPRRSRIMTPNRGSREPLRVETAVQIDSSAFGGAIRMVTDKGETVAGTASPLPDSPAWQFIPDRDWLPGRYRIEIRSDVEDVSGNSVQSAFDVIAGRSASLRDEQLLLSFEIGGRPDAGDGPQP